MQFGGFFREHRFYERREAVWAYRTARRLASMLGLQVVLKTFYSPIPDIDRLPRAVFDRRSSMAGIGFDLDRQLAFVEGLRPAMDEFRPPAAAAPDTPPRYVSDNPSYGLLDATVLYGVMRTLRPARVIELGSGYSTLTMAEAGLTNALDSRPMRLEVYDPFAA